MYTMFAAALVTSLMALSPLSAQPFRDTPPMGPQGLRPGLPPPECCFGLDLTDAQKQAFQNLFEKHHASSIERMKILEVSERSLQDAMMDPSVPESRVRTLHQAASEARLAMLLEGKALQLEMQALLTPVQQARAEEQRRRMRRPPAPSDLPEGPEEP